MQTDRFLLTCTVVLALTSTTAMAAETLYTNGQIYTANEHQPWADTMIVNEGVIQFIGQAGDAEQHLSDNFITQDLGDAFVMPGIIDGHTHPGLVAALTDEEGADEPRIPETSKEEMFEWLEQYASDNWYLPIVILGEWNVALFAPEGPHKDDLDKIFTYRPALLFDNSGHSMWLNSVALFLLGIDKDTPDLSPNISYFVRDENGEPTGWVKEFALFPYLGDLLLPGHEDLKQNLKTFLDYLNTKGVTSLVDGGNFSWHDPVYAALKELNDEGNLHIRYEGTYHVYHPTQIAFAIDELLKLREKYAGGLISFNTIKIHFDGVAEINTAGMLEPFANEPGNRGGVLLTTDELTDFILQLVERDINLHLHSVGDRATQTALDATEQARTRHGDALPIEITLAHLETTVPHDIERFKDLEVHANFTPHWFGGYFKGGDLALGPERSFVSQLARTYYDGGANVTFSSDVVTGFEAHRANPFFGIQTGVNRQEVSQGRDGAIMNPPKERLNIEQMIKGYTINGAKQMGTERHVGSLEVGKVADFIILDANPLTSDAYGLHKISPIAVYVGGEQVPITKGN
ncbi:N-substituted formamide deformylase [Rhodobiaceae bacterium]|nr:N-substituted formamide deformylase [Rhodobiaceae bacterium]